MTFDPHSARPLQCPIAFVSPKRALLLALSLLVIAASSSTAQITGTVYADYDQNGSRVAGELGVGGIQLAAYDDANTMVASATSDQLGQFSLAPTTGGTTYRVEMTIPSALGFYAPGECAVGDETDVVFVDGSASGVELGVHVPSDWCDASPDLVTTCFIAGAHDAAGTDALGAIVRVPYTLNGDNSASNQYLEYIDAVGATFGLAVHGDPDLDPSTDDSLIFAGAYGKRPADWGPGPVAATTAERAGSIYVMRASNIGMAAATVLDTIVIPNAAAAVNPTPRAQSFDPDGPGGASPALGDWERDSAMYAAVGKEGLGDLEISADGQTLWAMNLFDRNLYRVDLSGGIGSYSVVSMGSVADPGCAGGASDWRPFGLGEHHGELYVGGVCSGEANNTSPVRYQTNDGSSPGDLSDDTRTVLLGTDNIGQVSAHVLRLADPLAAPAATVATTHGALAHCDGLLARCSRRVRGARYSTRSRRDTVSRLCRFALACVDEHLRPSPPVRSGEPLPLYRALSAAAAHRHRVRPRRLDDSRLP